MEQDGSFKTEFQAPLMKKLTSVKFAIQQKGNFYTKQVKVTMDGKTFYFGPASDEVLSCPPYCELELFLIQENHSQVALLR